VVAAVVIRQQAATAAQVATATIGMPTMDQVAVAAVAGAAP
jgi:hypothetical protein